MSIHRYKDWRGWLDGMRSVSMKAGAESLVTNITGLIGTNGIAATVPFLNDIGLSWKTALCTAAIQFGLRTFLAASKYVAEKPDPAIIEEEVDTTIIKKQ